MGGPLTMATLGVDPTPVDCKAGPQKEDLLITDGRGKQKNSRDEVSVKQRSKEEHLHFPVATVRGKVTSSSPILIISSQDISSKPFN